MNAFYFFYFIISLIAVLAEASLPIRFSQTPCAVIYTPNSVLKNSLPASSRYYDSKRSRVSTCTGVCWMNDDKHLIAIGLESSSLDIYAFDSSFQIIEHVKHLDKKNGLALSRPSNGTIFPDFNLLAVGNLAGGTNLYFLDSINLLDPVPAFTINTHMAHGLQFSRNGAYLAVASLSSGIDIYSLTTPIHLNQRFGNPFSQLRAKSIDFSLDERFIAIGLCHMLTNEVSPKECGIIAIYPFDKMNGKINPNPVCQTDRVDSVETLVFHPSGTSLFAVDQAHDRIIQLDFDEKTGQIGHIHSVLEGEQSGLCFPHGLSFTSDGKFAAVSNHGDDKVAIYAISFDEPDK